MRSSGSSPFVLAHGGDRLVAQQDAIEAARARRHLWEGGVALSGLSSSWVEGGHCELAAFGHSRDVLVGADHGRSALPVQPAPSAS